MTVVAVALAREPPLWHCGLHGERRKQREEAGWLGLLLVVAKEREMPFLRCGGPHVEGPWLPRCWGSLGEGW